MTVILTAAAAAADAGCRKPGRDVPGVAQHSTSEAASAVDTNGLDPSVKPGDDFFRYANGRWLQATEIPPDKAVWGAGSRAMKDTNDRIRSLLEEAGRQSTGDPDEAKAGRYYAAYMNESAVEQRGLSSLQPLLDRIDAIADRRALATALGAELRADVDPLNNTQFHTDHLFGLFVAQDFEAPTVNRGYLLQGGLGMPDREYYLGDDGAMNEVRAKYKTHIARMLSLAGGRHSQPDVDGIYALETAIARAHRSRQESGDVQRANHRWSRKDFPARAPGLDWAALFTSAGLDDQDSFIVWQPDAITGEAALTASQPLASWKAWLRYHTVNHWANYLPQRFGDQRYQFYDRVLAGLEQMPPRWQRGLDATNVAMGEAVGKLYVGRYFPAAAKAEVEAMVGDLKSAFSRRIERLDWMSADTKSKAKAKLQSLIVGVGYPEAWRDYSDLEVTADDLLTNGLRAEQHEYRRALTKLHGPVDRHEWWLTPQTMDALNLPIQNALNFPAAFLQPPLFAPGGDAARNYSALGAFIGHEVSHAFDDQGSQFDASGRLISWWQPEDFAHFKAAAAQLVTQYSAYRPLPDLAVNGQQTLSENIADVAGLAVAYDAYRLAQANLGDVRGFNGDQRFFLSFAQTWRAKLREPLLRSMLIGDGHAPPEFRADTVRNLDAWYTAFDVRPGQRLFLAPDARVRVW